MESISYNTLTINGITKICDNNIYTINSNEVIKYQWHEYQLRYICEILKISILNNKTDHHLLPLRMAELIKQKTADLDLDLANINIKSDNLDKDIMYGIIPNKIKNTISNDNLGGTPSDMFKISDNNLYIVNPETIIFIHNGKGDSTENQRRKFSKKYKQKLANITWNMNDNNNRMISSKKHIQSSTNPFLKYGRLDWFGNSCYADSVIIMLLYPLFRGNISKFVMDNFINIQDIDITKLSDGPALCDLSRPNQEKSVKDINKIYKGFRHIHTLLNDHKLFNIYKFLKMIDKCPNKTQQIKYGDKGTHDSMEFLNHLMEIFNIKTSSSNTIRKYKFFKNDPTLQIYDDTLEGIFTDPVTNSNIQEETNNDNSRVIVNEIFFDDLNKILKTIKHEGDSISIDITRFLIKKREIYPDDFYHIFDTDLYRKIKIQDKIYIQNLNTGEEIDIKTLSEDNDIIQKVDKYIEEIIIDDADTLFFNIFRKGRIINSQGNNRDIIIDSVKIVPEPIIKLKSKVLVLKSIIVWYSNHYVTFFMNEDVWYLYNDLYSPSTSTPDYITRVGTYDELLVYSIASINNIIQTNSVLIWYQ